MLNPKARDCPDKLQSPPALLLFGGIRLFQSTYQKYHTLVYRVGARRTLKAALQTPLLDILLFFHHLTHHLFRDGYHVQSTSIIDQPVLIRPRGPPPVPGHP